MSASRWGTVCGPTTRGPGSDRSRGKVRESCCPSAGEHESEADESDSCYVARAGYDPRRVDFVLAADVRISTGRTTSGIRITHPSHENRIRNLARA